MNLIFVAMFRGKDVLFLIYTPVSLSSHLFSISWKMSLWVVKTFSKILQLHDLRRKLQHTIFWWIIWLFSCMHCALLLEWKLARNKKTRTENYRTNLTWLFFRQKLVAKRRLEDNIRRGKWQNFWMTFHDNAYNG